MGARTNTMALCLADTAPADPFAEVWATSARIDRMIAEARADNERRYADGLLAERAKAVRL